MKKGSKGQAAKSNSFSALAAYEDADALGEVVAAALDRRKNGGSSAAADHSNGGVVGFKQPLVRLFCFSLLLGILGEYRTHGWDS
jgi:hypothetical protein